MFRGGWKIGSIAGIPIRADASWAVIVLLWTWSWSSQFQQAEGVTSGKAYGYALSIAVVWFGSVFLHELAHAGVARAFRLKVHSITLVIFGGFTAHEPDRDRPWSEFLISFAGPATTLAIAFAVLAVSTSMTGLMEHVLRYVGLLQLVIGGLNFLPGLPLDGGHMLRAVVRSATHDDRKATLVAARAGMLVAVAIVAAGIWKASTGDQEWLLWSVILAAFIFPSAQAAARTAALQGRLVGGTVEQAMRPAPPAVPAAMTLSEALDRFLRGHEQEAFPVVEEDGRVIGMVSFSSARQVGMDDPLRPVRDALIPLEQVLTVQASDPLDQVGAALGSGRMALVLRDGTPAGAIGSGDIANWARARSG